jgi:hypothetical protein
VSHDENILEGIKFKADFFIIGADGLKHFMPLYSVMKIKFKFWLVSIKTLTICTSNVKSFPKPF